jgi:hypothetical protein
MLSALRSPLSALRSSWLFLLVLSSNFCLSEFSPASAQNSASISFFTGPAPTPRNGGNGLVISGGNFALPPNFANVTYEFKSIEIKYGIAANTPQVWSSADPLAATVNQIPNPKSWSHTNNGPTGLLQGNTIRVKATLKWVRKQTLPVAVNTDQELEIISAPVTVTNP